MHMQFITIFSNANKVIQYALRRKEAVEQITVLNKPEDGCFSLLMWSRISSLLALVSIIGFRGKFLECSKGQFQWLSWVVLIMLIMRSTPQGPHLWYRPRCDLGASQGVVNGWPISRVLQRGGTCCLFTTSHQNGALKMHHLHRDAFALFCLL